MKRMNHINFVMCTKFGVYDENSVKILAGKIVKKKKLKRTCFCESH